MTQPPPDQAAIHIWKDAANDRVSITWEHSPGYYVNTDHPHIMARINAAGQITGLQAEAFSRLPQEPLRVRPCLPSQDSP